LGGVLREINIKDELNEMKFIKFIATGFVVTLVSLATFIAVNLILLFLLQNIRYSGLVGNSAFLILLTVSFSCYTYLFAKFNWVYMPEISITFAYIILAITLTVFALNDGKSKFGLIVEGAPQELPDQYITGFPSNIFLTAILWLLPAPFIYFSAKFRLKKMAKLKSQ
jgi:hypothetical protein